MKIRPARPGEAGVLSALALRSKAHWADDRAFLDSVRQALALSEGDLVAAPVFVLETDGVTAGFYRIVGRPPRGELSDIWLEPTLIGPGRNLHRAPSRARTRCSSRSVASRSWLRPRSRLAEPIAGVRRSLGTRAQDERLDGHLPGTGARPADRDWPHA